MGCPRIRGSWACLLRRFTLNEHKTVFGPNLFFVACFVLVCSLRRICNNLIMSLYRRMVGAPHAPAIVNARIAIGRVKSSSIGRETLLAYMNVFTILLAAAFMALFFMATSRQWRHSRPAFAGALWQSWRTE